MIRSAFVVCALIAAGAALAENRFVPNSVKYRDTGHQPATGRAGDASIEALALLDKAGVAEVEIQAGAPGTLQHVQVKTDRFTDNYNTDGASFVATLPDTGHGASVSVLANVDTGARVGVVTANETVVLRPDLAPTQIVVSTNAEAGMPTQITAAVRERNGELGARATCALRIDGQLVDRATNIWVDAGGNVSCLFLHTFATGGEKQLEVTLEDVAPRDYDFANNSVSRTVHVRNPGEIVPTAWFLYASESGGWQESRGWSVWGHDSTTRGTYWQQDVQLGVTAQNVVVNMEQMQLRYAETSEGRTILALDPVPLTITPLVRHRQCGFLVDPEGTVEVFVCQRWKNNDRFGGAIDHDVVSVDIRRESRDATYYSHESAPAIDGSPAYDREYYSVYTGGPQVPYGDSVTFDIELTDGAQTMQLVRTVPLQRTDYPYYDNTNCWGSWCQQSRGEGWMKWGQTSE